jgi:hypothetical protein
MAALLEHLLGKTDLPPSPGRKKTHRSWQKMGTRDIMSHLRRHEEIKMSLFDTVDKSNRTKLERFKPAIIIATLVLLIIIIIVAIMGPAGIERSFSGWSASAYGSDWLVIQYTQDGSIISAWELKDKSVGNESNSDGIYFVDDSDNVVHLSGHYIYVQIKNGNWDAAKDRLLKGRRGASQVLE